MRLQINGAPRDFPDGLTIGSLLEQLMMKPDRVAVELNLEIVPRLRWDGVRLKEGDKLEIVHFVGGGLNSSPGIVSRNENDYHDYTERIVGGGS